MQFSITRQQVGLLLAVLGAIALAFSVRTKSQYEGEKAEAVNKAKTKDPTLFEPTETYIVRGLFWGGLVLVALGALLQW